MLDSVVNRVWKCSARRCQLAAKSPASAASQAAEQRLHQLGVGVFGVGLLGFQAVAQGHQFIDFGDDAVLFGEWGHRDYQLLHFSLVM